MIHCTDRILEAAAELRHMEDITNLGEVRRQLQLICHLSTFGEDRERADVARSQLALDPKSMSAPHWSDTWISLFARSIDHLLVLAVIIALLTRLSCLQIFMNNTDLFFGVLDNILTKEWSFPSF